MPRQASNQGKENKETKKSQAQAAKTATAPADNLFGKEPGSDDNMEDFFGVLGDPEIDVVDEEAAEDETNTERLRIAEASAESGEASALATPGVARGSDPVRMYLREMGGVSLLTREGEVVIAKRIEEGQQDIEKEVNRSPVTLVYILELAENLKNGLIRVKDLFDEDDSGPEEEELSDEEEEVEEEVVDEDGEVKEKVSQETADEEEAKKEFIKSVQPIKKHLKAIQEAFVAMKKVSKTGKAYQEHNKKYEKLRDKSQEKILEIGLSKKHTEFIIKKLQTHASELRAINDVLEDIKEETGRSIDELY
ncbi:MAG: hypothetical protein KBC84_00795, partial [Proteobacteria bacterium]|nr:hypothetical protein [Pseudomonadota bacterium]